MKSLVLLFVLGVARTGGSIDTRDPQYGAKQVDFVNNGVVNGFAGLPAIVQKAELKFESEYESSESTRYITLATINMSWLDGKEVKVKEDLQERAKYGMGKVMDVEGQVIHITDAHNSADHSACNHTLQDSFGNSLASIATPWIALIRRGSCDFEKKILNVYRQKASGVIIYNNMSGVDLNYMKITKRELLEGNITSVFTPMYKGLELADKIDTYKHVVVTIKVGTRFDKRTSLNHRSSVLFVTISFIIVMVISMLWLVVYYYQRFRYLQTKENEQKMDSNKAKEALKKIPTMTIKTLSKVTFAMPMPARIFIGIAHKPFFLRNSKATAVLCASKLTESTTF
jgi:PA domain